MKPLHKKIKKYNDKIEAFKLFDPNDMELYRWLIDLGKKLKNDPLPDHLRTEENRVSRCQFGLFVDRVDGIFKAFSDGYISSGYAAILLDVFNSLSDKERTQVKIEDFREFKIESLLTMTRSDGFYQMVELMIRKAKE
jgi:cysteine desulfuration protein SufE|tara:strand:- start:160 stop:573 length:414 start_codon:yes stop_codon:yes gene_type:complete